MKKIGLIIISVFLLNSCWAPRCPVDGCQFVREHRHNDLVTGTFRSQYMVFPTIHFLWDGKQGEKKPEDLEFEPKGKRKVKVKKKFPWERW